MRWSSRSVWAVGVLVMLSTAASSLAGDGKLAGDEKLVSVTCSAGEVTAKAQAPWHTNAKAPWKWDKGDKVSVDEHAARFKGPKCEGTVKAFVCNADQCRGPILISVK